MSLQRCRVWYMESSRMKHRYLARCFPMLIKYFLPSHLQALLIPISFGSMFHMQIGMKGSGLICSDRTCRCGCLDLAACSLTCGGFGSKLEGSVISVAQRCSRPVAWLPAATRPPALIQVGASQEIPTDLGCSDCHRHPLISEARFRFPV